MIRRLATASAAIVFATVSLADASAPPRPPAGDYRQHPVFYEAFPDRSASRRGDSLDLLRRGAVRLQHYPEVDISTFAWEQDSFIEYTWRTQMEELRFLLPAIASDRPDDRRLAWEWFLSWYAAHMVPTPETARWGGPMSTAYRALVLVYLLKTEEGRNEREPGLIDYLRATILEHQRYLALPQNAPGHSNHGFMTGLALFETTRVFAQPSLAATARERLLELMDRAVSPAGVEREHAPAYHFAVLRWLDQTSDYVASLPGHDRRFVERTRAVIERMRRAGYFLEDHRGLLAPIGDTDSMTVDDFVPAGRVLPAKEPALFDPSSGYAIYKGSGNGGDCRYLVFRIPGGEVEMDRHFHADALSVFFSHAGETILGDTGRYGYDSSPFRQHCISPAAHSTVMPYPGFSAYNPRAKRLVTRPVDCSRGGENAWSASMAVGQSICRRTVRISGRDSGFAVVDSISSAHPGREPDSSEVMLLWNLGIGVMARRAAAADARHVGWDLTTRSGKRIRLSVALSGPPEAGIAAVNEVHGQESPPLGWYSPAQGVARPVTALVIRVRRSPDAVVSTRVEVVDGGCDLPAEPSPGGRKP